MLTPNTYEDSVCQEIHFPCERIFFVFFRRVRAGAVVSRSGVLPCFRYSGAHPWGCTTPVLRFSHPWRDDGRAALLISSATEKSCRTLRPSYAKAWLSHVDSPVSLRLGGGAAHATCYDYRRLFRSQRGGPSTASGSGLTGRCTPWRSQTQSRQTHGMRNSGPSPGVSSEARGSPALLPSARRKRSISQAVWRLRMS
jgi:hypothetical protein